LAVYGGDHREVEATRPHVITSRHLFEAVRPLVLRRVERVPVQVHSVTRRRTPSGESARRGGGGEWIGGLWRLVGRRVPRPPPPAARARLCACSLRAWAAFGAASGAVAGAPWQRATVARPAGGGWNRPTIRRATRSWTTT